MSTPTPRSRAKKTPIPPASGDMEEAKEKTDATQEHAPEDFYQLRNKEGQVIFTSTILKNKDFYKSTRDKHFAENIRQILMDADDADVNMSEIDLAGTNFAGQDLSNMNLAGMNLEDCNFNGANLINANLAGCDLRDAHFDRTRMTGASVIGADLRDTNFANVEARHVDGIALMGELDQWSVYGYPLKMGDNDFRLMIRAGCRHFTLAEARDHWEGNDDRREIVAALHLLEVIAKNRGWRTTDEPLPQAAEGEIVAGDGPRAEPVDEEDEE